MWPQRRRDPQVENHLSRDSLRTRDCFLPQVNVTIFESGVSHPKSALLTTSENSGNRTLFYHKFGNPLLLQGYFDFIAKESVKFWGCHLCLTLICHAQFLCCRRLPYFVFPHVHRVLFCPRILQTSHLPMGFVLAFFSRLVSHLSVKTAQASPLTSSPVSDFPGVSVVCMSPPYTG